MDAQDIIDYYVACDSIRKTAKHFGIAYQTAQRIIISGGVTPEGQNTTVYDMLEKGYSTETIAEQCGISVKAIRAHMPYTRGSYVVGDKSDNAKRIKEWRNRKSGQNT